MRTSMKTIQEDSERGSLQSYKQINDSIKDTPQPEEMDRSQSVTPISSRKAEEQPQSIE